MHSVLAGKRYERIRSAWEAVRDARSRLAFELFATEMLTRAEVLEWLLVKDEPRRPELDRVLRFLGGR